MARTEHRSALLPRDETARTHIQDAAIVVGAAFILVGILGFIPGLTTHYHGTGGMGFSGRNSHAELFGVFRVSVLHNGVHLVLGGAGLIASFKPVWARLYLLIGGLVYLVLFVYGLVIDFDSSANFVPLNTADNWLHLVLAVAMIAVGLLIGREPKDRR
jgi:hypothetical protein